VANVGVFESGYEQGLGIGTEKRARKQEEHELRIQTLLDQQEKLQKKRAAVKGTPEEAANNQDIYNNQAAIIEAYHPDHHPDAIAKYGHLLMERMHLMKQPTSQSVASQPSITIPGEMGAASTVLPAGPQTTVVGPAMTPHQRDQFNKKQQVIQSRTSALEAAAPATEEEAAQQRRIAEADSRAIIDSMKETFHRLVPNPTPEQQDQFDSVVLQAALGIKPTQQAGNWVEKPGHLKDGTPATLLYNSKDGTYKTRTGEEVSQEVLAQWTEDAKPTKMTANDRLWDAYAATLHKTTDQLTMQDKPGFELWLNGLKMRSTNRQAIIYDRDGNGYIIDLTSTSGPVEVGVIPKGGTAPSASSGAGAPPSATPGAGRAPSTPSRSGATGGVGILHLIQNFKKATPDYTKAKAMADSTNDIAILADKWIQHPGSEADKNFVLALIRSEAGRVNQQEIQMMMTAGGAGMFIPRALANLTTGELPPELRQQLVDFVHLQQAAAKQVLDEKNAPPPNASPSGPQALPPGW
jgi:hypothetical protein